ncbi:hypothetical protein WJX84_003053 [Apatococcus fuscideae]|uniref:proline--tRNA ligase n=1 Tax=Apatococcus fuscideae TaxID=2026836 RepID=A0AAW1TGU6_9CHLO
MSCFSFRNGAHSRLGCLLIRGLRRQSAHCRPLNGTVWIARPDSLQKPVGGKAGVTPKSEDFNRWYLDVVKFGELADYGPVRGTMVIRPWGYSLWESIQQYLDRRFKETGHSNAYFPMLIPRSFVDKEASHVEGFAPELAIVTQGGGKELEEPLVIRPTSETMVNHMFSQWIQGYRDLPLLLNQWANVVRWELRTRPFLRTLEFLWQEGHCAFATAEEAEKEARDMLDIYVECATQVAAMPVVPGRKSAAESFAGAVSTYTIEAMMSDGRALQAGTSHNLGQNFAKAFDTTFLDSNGERKFVHQVSFGMSTRMIGGVIGVHGDDNGLQLPPLMAPVQVVFVPILKKDGDEAGVMEAVSQLAAAAQAAGIRTKVDADPNKSPGFRFNYWELKGVPLRVELGPRDVEQGSCIVARRDRPGKEGKSNLSMDEKEFVAGIQQALQDVQANMYTAAMDFREANIVDVESYEQLQAAVAAGKWARGPWAGSSKDENIIKEATSATLRCIPFEQPEGLPKPCLLTGAAASEVAIFAKAY